MRVSAVRPSVVGTFVALMCVLPSPSILAGGPGIHLSQLEHSTWRLQDGVFNSAPRGIAQTKDGYLWIGTLRGLVRFDGVRFVPWKPPENQPSGLMVIRSLLAGRDGSLWIGTSTGLAHWTNGNLITYPGPVAYIESIFESRDGTVWIARSRIHDWSGPVCKVEGLKLHCYGKSDGIRAISVRSIIEDERGSLWFGGSGEIIERTGEQFHGHPVPGVAPGRDYSINGLANSPDNSVWVGLEAVEGHLGLEHFAAGRWKAFSTPSFDGSTHEITTLFRDREGSLWVGTDHSGIYRIDGNQVDTFDRSDGLSSNNITGFQQDSEGDIWVTTAAGLDVFRKRPVMTYSSREGLSADGVHAVINRKDGSIWMSNSSTLDVLTGGHVKSIGAHDGLPGRAPSSMMEDNQGRLWVGVDTGLFVYMNGRFRNVLPVAPDDTVAGLAQDLQNDIWAELAGPSPKLVRIRDFKVQEEFDPPAVPPAYSAVADPKGGVWINLLDHGLFHLRNGVREQVTLDQFSVGQRSSIAVFNLHIEADGTLWGASNKGLIGYRNGRPQALSERNGLPCNSIYAVITDRRSAIWLYSQCGLVKIDRDEINRWWSAPDSKIRVRVFDSADGMQPGVPLFRPAATRSDDGRLWFANGAGVQVVDPEQLENNGDAPPVNIEQLVADEHTFSLSGTRALPALTRDIQIQYTALSFLLPSRVRFRYRLEGYEQHWQEPGARRAAFYSNLNPGTYRFHVIASNNDGVWNESGATLDFKIAAAFYQTSWFRASSLILAMIVLWQIYLWRIQRFAEQMQMQNDIRTVERERIARDLHDTLLQGFHGIMLRLQRVMKDLPPGGTAQKQLEAVLDRADEVILEGRERVSVLRSRAQMEGNLPEAVKTVGSQLVDGSNIIFRCDTLGEPAALRADIFEEVYQIAREALSNACRHSRALEIGVEFTYAPRRLTMTIADNGVGIDNGVLATGKAGHWGLTGMRERAQRIKGVFEITSSSNSGTRIQVRVPGRLAYKKSGRRSFVGFPGRGPTGSASRGGGLSQRIKSWRSNA